MNERRFQRKLERMRMKGERQKAQWEVESEYEEYYPHREGAKVSNVMLFVIIVAIALYTVASFYVVFASGVNIDATLTTCFYAFWTCEILALAGIRISKIKKNKDKDKGDAE